jgi:tetratricopeptide (TPR) repeat protein
VVTPCPTDDVLGALVHQALEEAEVARVTSHLDDCATCRQVVIAAVRGGVAPTIAIGTPTLEPGIRAEASGPRIGSKLGRYELRVLLGAGGMGRVYEAYDAELDRAIALKIMRPELSGTSGTLAERLVRESRIMAKLAHPALITVYDVGKLGAAVFIAMELIRGETLGAYVRRKRPGWREVVGLLERAAYGLAAAHDAGIIHRDFKPENVLVAITGSAVSRVVVTDFGVACSFGDADDPASSRRPSAVDLTATGVTVGTPAYMAPEQLDGDEVDHRADVFAFAVSAWELLFGARPFAGKTVEEIRVAMLEPPRALRSGVPDRVVRALERGLAIDPADRWPDMASFARALVPPVRKTRALAIGAVGLALVGGGIAGAGVFGGASEPEDPCLRSARWLATDYDARLPQLRTKLAGDKHATAVLASLDQAAKTWRETHRATCRADRDPPQAANTAGCLEARRLELAAVVDDLILDGPRHARIMAELASPATSCASPAPAYLVARVPADPVLRRKVTAIRHRAFDAEAARDRGDFPTAIKETTQLATESLAVWPNLHAEVLYLLGTSLGQGGDVTKGATTMREAAALAERVHHGYIAANAWIQLIQTATADEGDPVRALEYAAYADAAVERIGRPVATATLLEYSRGAALVAAERPLDGEAAFRKGIELARGGAPELMPELIQGLGFVYEDQARFADAAKSYREALVEFAKQPTQAPQTEITFRTRLAFCLAMLGDDAAEAEGRRALDLATKVLGADNLERALTLASFAQVLRQLGRLDEALVEAHAATTQVAKVSGRKTERYAETLYLEAEVLLDLTRYREANTAFTRACDIIEDLAGENEIHQGCENRRAFTLSKLGKHTEALAIVDDALEDLEEMYGVAHVEVANAYLIRGMIRHALGRDDDAVLDLEVAYSVFDEYIHDAGSIAATEFALGQALWKKEPKRARELVETAINGFAPQSAWNATRSEAIAWLAKRR